MSSREEYDISDAEELILFENGDTIAVPLNKLLLGSFEFYRKLLEEDDYKDLLKKGSEEAIRYLIEQNRYFLLMEESWEKIFNAIKNNIEALERYYPMVRVKPTTDDHIQIVRALVLNDELYQYCINHLAS